MTFPSMAAALWGISETINLAVVRKDVVDHEIVEATSDPIQFKGILQPQTARALLIKPEGQRTWKWWTLWTQYRLELDTMIQDPAGVQFRVMKVNDWHNAAFFEYELTQGPTQ